MIKTWESLGETLADFETRLSYLENSQRQPMPESQVEEHEEQPKEIIHRHINYSSILKPMEVKKIITDYLKNRGEHNIKF